MISQLNSLSRDDIYRVIADQERRINQIMALLQGQPIGTVRIADAAITDAKIQSLSADKITTGTLVVQVGVGESVDGSIVLDGVNVRITMSDADNMRLLIGDDGT